MFKLASGSIAAALGLIQAAHGMPQAVSSATAPSGVISTGVPSITISTAVASPSAPLNSALPSQVPLPPKQAWCPSEIFCAGPLLQSVNLAKPYVDPKTFVDKPTAKAPQQVLSDFQAINNASTTEGAIVSFLNSDFKGEGLELQAFALPQFNPTPAFLNNVTDPLLKAWSQIVHGYWTQLARNTDESALCRDGSCESTLIPLNHTFVVPGGRFREQYYWDSYWIVRGLLKSELFSVANGTLQNFMDELEHIGFIPNGGRIYYLNRSQPPMFIRMLGDYVQATNDTDILKRALPLAEKELLWWATNRTSTITSPFTNQTHSVARYSVTNTAPRPESYLQDYTTANDPNLATPLTEEERADVYAQLATGAESGWDYSSRWMKDPLAADPNQALRSLNIKNIIPVDLNSILYNAHVTLARLYTQQGNSSAADAHSQSAGSIRAAVLDLFWDKDKFAFYDFNTTSGTRNSLWSVATFYPLWAGIVPDELVSSSQNAFKFFSAVNMVLNRYNGTVPTTFLETGQQWDAPNAWPMHQHIITEALKAIPDNIISDALPTPPDGQSTFSLIPSGQLDVSEDQLPSQSVIGSGNASKTGTAADINRLNGTIVNGGNATEGEGWTRALQRQIANRYFASALCSWYATGGEIPNFLPRLSEQELNVTQSVNNTGNMFEKFSVNDIDSAGRGGEYTVQAGFGWTNGVVLIFASEYGDVLVRPQCPDVLAEAASGMGTSNGNANNAAVPAKGFSVFTTFVAAGLVALAML